MKGEVIIITREINAIKSLNVEDLQTIIGINPLDKMIFSNDGEMYQSIYSIDLSRFLGITGKTDCILADHDNPQSAMIWTTDEGVQIYKCFECKQSYSILKLVQILAHCSKHNAIKFIKSVYNISVVSSNWEQEWKEIFKENISYINSCSFQNDYPELYARIRRKIPQLSAMLYYFTDFISEQNQLNGKPIFYSSYNDLMKVTGIKKSEKLAKVIELLALLDMIIKVQIKDIPEEMIERLRAIKKENNQKKLINCYQFDDYGIDTLTNAEDKAIILKDNHCTLQGISREYVLRTFGKEMADKIFPQYHYNNSVGTSKQSNELTFQIGLVILASIEKNGYILEREIMENEEVGTQWKKSIQEILDTYGLVRVRASKANRERYNLDIDDNIPYQSFIIVQN